MAARSPARCPGPAASPQRSAAQGSSIRTKRSAGSRADASGSFRSRRCRAEPPSRPRSSERRDLELPHVAVDAGRLQDVIAQAALLGDRLERREGCEPLLPIDECRSLAAPNRDGDSLPRRAGRELADFDRPRGNRPEVVASAYRLGSVRRRQALVDGITQRPECFRVRLRILVDHERLVRKREERQLVARQAGSLNGHDDVPTSGTVDAVDADLVPRRPRRLTLRFAPLEDHVALASELLVQPLSTPPRHRWSVALARPEPAGLVERLQLRLDDAVVAVAAPVADVDVARVGVLEDEEVMADELQLQDSLLGTHRLHVELLRLDDQRLRRHGLDGGRLDRAGGVVPASALVPVALDLALELVDELVD